MAQDVIVPGKTGYLYESDVELETLLCSLINDQARCEGISRIALKARDVFDGGTSAACMKGSWRALSVRPSLREARRLAAGPALRRARQGRGRPQ